MMKAIAIFRSAFARSIAAARLRSLGNRRHVALALWMGFFGLSLSVLAAPPSFQAPIGLIVADFNHDGIPDVLSPSTSPTALTISFGVKPNGTFNPVAKTVPYPALCANIYTNAVVVGDFNGDGYPDIAVSCFGGQLNGTFILLGNGDGTFTQGATISGLSNLVAGDFNKDGKVDLVTEGTNSNNQQTLIFYAGNGDGTFAAPVTTALSNLPYGAVAAVDVNQDGYTDLVLGYFSSSSVNTVYVFGNNKDGTFGVLAPTSGVYSANTSVGVGSYPAAAEQSISVGNFYGNGSIDLAVPDSGTTPGVYVLKNTSTSTTYSFVASKTAVPSLLSAQAANVVAGSPAGLSDLLVYNGTNLTVLANNGSGTFSASYAGLTVPTTSPLYTTADANGDGHADIYAGNTTSTGTTLAVSLISGSASATSSAFSLPAGTFPVSATWPGNINFAGSTATGSQIVNALVPVITWPTPAAITYGTPLSATQLNATAANTGGQNIPGTFVYTPATGTVLNAGTQTLSVVFTPTDLTNYTTATQSVQIVVNPTTPTVTFVPAVAMIPYGTPLGASQLNAVATGIGGVTVPGAFVYTPAAGTVLSVGTQTLRVVFTPTSSNYAVQTGSAQLTVTQATPTLTWATPSPIAYGVPLSATQLNASATGVGGTALPGTFVYTPAVGTVLSPGSQTLSVVFTPTDVIDYTTATTSVKLQVTDLVFTSFTPNTATIGDAAKTITITGSGFVASTVAQIGTTALATTLVNPTTLTAVVPASNFLVAGTLQISLKSPATGTTSQSLPLTVTAPVPAVTVTAPTTAAPGTQPAVTLAITNPYPVPLTATFTLTNAPAGTPAVDDPAVQFATGGRTETFTIPAGSTTVPNVQIQTGTVAGTITVTLVLTENGVNVTPTNVAAPNVITVPAAVPSVTAATLTRSGTILTVITAGFSNDREIVKANFHFVAAPGFSISTPDITADVASAFATWFANPQSLQYGSTFHYAQDFDVSDDASHIGSVVVTLTNKLGVSTSQTAQ